MISRQNFSATDPETYFLDTSILMYAAGQRHPLREPCRSSLRAAVNLGLKLVTDAGVLQEILHRYFSLRRPDVARTVYAAAVDLCEEVLPVYEKHTKRALELLLHHTRLSARDALHVATMEGQGIRLLLSTDGDFDGLKQVERIDPQDFPTS